MDDRSDKEDWSDKLKRHIKPKWKLERDLTRLPETKDLRPGHLLWVLAFGKPEEFDSLFSANRTRPIEGDESADSKWRSRANDSQVSPINR